VPYFWSEQFGRMVQYAGHHTAAGQLVWRGDPGGADWSVCWLASAGGAGAPRPGAPAAQAPLVAVLTVGRPRDLLQGRRLIASGVPVNPARLADPSIPLRDCAAGAG